MGTEEKSQNKTMDLLVTAMEQIAADIHILKSTQQALLATSLEVEAELKQEKEKRAIAEEVAREFEKELLLRKEREERLIIEEELSRLSQKKKWYQRWIG